jgi:biopolymer transport protein ExbB/TolQ
MLRPAGRIGRPTPLFLQAGPVVKFVLACLIGASVWCWFIIFESLWSLMQIGRALRSRGAGGGGIGRAIAGVFATGHAEAEIDLDGEDIGNKQQRIVSAMKRRAQEMSQRRDV